MPPSGQASGECGELTHPASLHQLPEQSRFQGLPRGEMADEGRLCLPVRRTLGRHQGLPQKLCCPGMYCRLPSVPKVPSSISSPSQALALPVSPGKLIWVLVQPAHPCPDKRCSKVADSRPPYWTSPHYMEMFNAPGDTEVRRHCPAPSTSQQFTVQAVSSLPAWRWPRDSWQAPRSPQTVTWHHDGNVS